MQQAAHAARGRSGRAQGRQQGGLVLAVGVAQRMQLREIRCSGGGAGGDGRHGGRLARTVHALRRSGRGGLAQVVVAVTKAGSAGEPAERVSTS